jgi:hypothetical protein
MPHLPKMRVRTLQIKAGSNTRNSNSVRRFHVSAIPETSKCPVCSIAQIRNYPWSAESWAILQAAGVFDSVTRNEIAIIEESLEEKTEHERVPSI